MKKLLTILLLSFLISCNNQERKVIHSDKVLKLFQISEKDKLWEAKQNINIVFENSTNQERKIFLYALNIWSQYINLSFDIFIEELSDENFRTNTIRVKFDVSDRSYSAVGTDYNKGLFKNKYLNISIPVKRKMEFLSTSLHEIGHALGLKHEHQHPDSFRGISFESLKKMCKFQFGFNVEDEDELSRCLYNLSPYDKTKRDQFIISDYDKQSIMHYEGVAGNDYKKMFGLTLKDKKFISEMYPFKNKLDTLDPVLMHSRDKEELDSFILVEYANSICELSIERGDIFLSKSLNGIIKKVKLPSIMALDNWFSTCSR